MPPAKPSPKAPQKSPPKPTPQQNKFETVDPIWLLKALALSFLAALFCAWLTACLLFYLGEWQLVLHPDHNPSPCPQQTPAASLPCELVHFDAAATGQPRLTAWWIPTQTQQPPTSASLQPPRYAAYTILYLHDGSLSLAATAPALARLHQAGLNIFAIDYRGFGQSDLSAHPTEATMAQDTAAALDYLTSVRHLAADHIVPYGVGLGASLAANLAHTLPELPAVILDNPDPDPTATAVAAHPSRVVPVRLLFREHFEIAAPLATLTPPKLLIAGGPNAPVSATTQAASIRTLQLLFQHAASPSRSVTLPPPAVPNQQSDANTQYFTTLTRFLDEYLH